MSYGHTSPLGGSRIFYSSTFTLGLITLSYSGWMNFAKSNIRISLSLSPGEPLITDERLLPVKTLKILFEVFPRPLCPSTLQSPTTNIPLWITTYNCRSYLHPQLLLLLQDALNCSPLFRKSFKLTALQFFTTWIPPLKIPRTYWVSVHPQLFVCFIRYSEILSDLLSILFKLLLCKYLYAYIMDAPISLAIFTSIFWHWHFDPIDSTCVRMHTIINRPF